MITYQARSLERLDLSYNNLRELDSASLASLTNLLVLKVTKFESAFTTEVSDRCAMVTTIIMPLHISNCIRLTYLYHMPILARALSK